MGDIITAKLGEDASVKNPNNTVTHRIIEIDNTSDTPIYTTKGDANDVKDLSPRLPNLILGKVIFAIPYIGYPVGFAKTQTGFILLIVIPATIIVYSELLNAKKEVQSIIKRRHEKKDK